MTAPPNWFCPDDLRPDQKERLQRDWARSQRRGGRSPIAPVLSFVCGGCGREFATKGEKKRHKRETEGCANWAETIASLNRQIAAVQQRNPELCAAMDRDWERPLRGSLDEQITEARTDMGEDRWNELERDWA